MAVDTPVGNVLSMLLMLDWIEILVGIQVDAAISNLGEERNVTFEQAATLTDAEAHLGPK